MKIRQIALLVSGLSFSAISFAAPVTPAEIDAARSNSTLQQAWITGASAPTQTVYEGWVRGCDANTNSIFTTSGGTSVRPGSIGNYSAYACKRGGIVSVLYHTLDGGSLNAYTPHTIGSVLARVKYVGTGSGCAATPLTYVDNVNPANNADVYKSCTQIGANLPSSGSTEAVSSSNASALADDPNAPQVPVGGYSDVEAALFSASIGGGNVSTKGIESDAGVGQAFGLAVSIPLYRALQQAQGLEDVDDNSFEPANAPNINSAQYTSLITPGGTQTWGVLLPGNTNKVRIERRVDTSGTQSSSNAFFLKNPCASGVNQDLPPANNTQNTANYIVTLHSGSSNVKTAISAASTTTNTADQFAIGVLSLENNWRTESLASNAGYRYVKIDGVHPETGDTVRARRTSVNGDYKFHMEMKQFVRADYAGKPPKTAFEAAVLGQITNALKNPDASTCNVFPRGLTLNPANGSSCTVGVEVAKVTNLGNNCAAPIQF